MCVEGPTFPLMLSGKALSGHSRDLFVSSSRKEGNELTWNPSPFGMLDETMEFPCLLLVSKLDLPTAASRLIPGCTPIRELEALGTGGQWSELNPPSVLEGSAMHVMSSMRANVVVMRAFLASCCGHPSLHPIARGGIWKSI